MKVCTNCKINHIIPHSFFEYSDLDSLEFIKCLALNYLKPNSSKQNNFKRAKLK